MNKQVDSLDDYTLFRLLCELEAKAVCSQRDLARRLDAALGLVNNYLKVATAKGWVRVKEISVNRCSYQLTLKGAARQRQLALQHSRYLDRLIRVVLDLYRPLCRNLKEQGVERVALCGTDGAEPAWLALQEAGIEISQVMDSEGVGSRFMGREVVSLAHAMLSGVHRVLIGSRTRGAVLYKALRDLGLDPAVITLPEDTGETTG